MAENWHDYMRRVAQLNDVMCGALAARTSGDKGIVVTNPLCLLLLKPVRVRML